MTRLIHTIVTIGFLTLTALDLAAAPRGLRYQARWTDDAGVPLTGSHDVVCAIFDAAVGGSQLWSEGPRSVSPANGVVDILVGCGENDVCGDGDDTPIPPSVFDGDERWLEIRIDGDVLGPRQQLSSVPHALTTDRLDGKTASDFLDTSATPQTKAGNLTVTGDLITGGSVTFPDGSVLQSARPDPPCFDGANRFVDCGNGTVTDTVTGLIWLKDASCSELGTHDWIVANQVAVGLGDGMCGLNDRSSPGDWHLPTRDQWAVILNQAGTNGCSSPAFPDRVGLGCCGTEPCDFIGVLSTFYWTSSSEASSPGDAGMVNLGNGNAGFTTKAFVLPLWPVRGGP